MSAWTLRSLITPSVILCAIWLLLLGCDCQHNGSCNSVSVLWKGVGFTNKGLYNQSYGFSSSHVWMWELDHKECWAPKNWCSWTMVLDKTLESLLDCKEIKPVHPKGNQPSIFIGRTVAEAEAPLLWPLDAKSQLNGKDPNVGKDWGLEEKGVIEGEMIGWHHGFNGHEFYNSRR